MRTRMLMQLAIFFLFLLISYTAVENPFTSSYIEGLNKEALMVTKLQDPLYEEIKKRAVEFEEPPIDAVVDRVWKAIPGYNGLKVDIDASFEKMKLGDGFDKSKLVFKQVPPAVHLADLPPTPIYKGNPEKPMVTFLVNVAWGNEYLPTMLKVLNERHIKTTFFLDGSWTKNHPTLAKMILEEGHEIGNHAYSHPDMKQLTAARIHEEIEKTNDVIFATLEVTPKWFAPPSGSFRQEVVDIAASLNMKTILWSVDTVDWKKPNTGEMVTRVLNKVHPGAMILMHPTEPTANGLNSLIEGIQAKGYHIGTVS
ncbi:MAG TPA: polysaccharide deacetylase family protein, partial [Bacilli bacterium]|nr:polysaccharide deacetylase family protein [Bacilli bacterium]